MQIKLAFYSTLMEIASLVVEAAIVRGDVVLQKKPSPRQNLA